MMIYILMIWTVVGGAAKTAQSPHITQYDWRPLGEFFNEDARIGSKSKTAQQMCDIAAKELGLKTENYRCVRSK